MIIEINIKLGHKCKHYHTDNIEIGNTGDTVHVTTQISSCCRSCNVDNMYEVTTKEIKKTNVSDIALYH